jgi:hypothetical protein
VVVAAGSVVAAIISYPEMLDDPHAGIWTAVLVAAFGIYGAAAVRAALACAGSAQQAAGFGFGVVAGLLWLGEIWTQGPAGLSPGMERTVPAGCAVLAVLTTVAAGVVGALVSRNRAAAIRTGTWAGLVSGAVMVTGVIAVQTSNLGLLGARDDYKQELAASGMGDMATYLASDAVAASTAHMIINVALGLLGAALGSIIVGPSTGDPTA